MAGLPKEKQDAYASFLIMMRAAVIFIAFTLVALASFAFGHVLPTIWGFLTLIIGTLVLLIDLMRRSRFVFSLTVLGIVAVITAMNLA